MNIFKGKINSLKKKSKKRTTKKSLGNRVRIHRNVGESMKLHRDRRARKRAEYLATLPKSPIKRFFYRLKPDVMAKFIFSREGAIKILKVAGITLAVFIVFMLALFAYFRKDLPKNVTDLKTCSQGASTTYYDRTGETLLWASSGDVECYPVPTDQISSHFKNAVVAIEDKDFYNHGGFSIPSIIRAGINDIFNTEGPTQGGSTITQQFVKLSLLSSERTLTRKLKELILSIELERTYSKDEILNAYLNEISLGSVYNGAEAAAKGYFNKPAKKLTIDESAMLAAVIPAPTYYSPYGSHVQDLVNRQHYVINQMLEQGYISKDEAEAAKKVDTLTKVIPISNKYKGIVAPHFVLAVQEQLEKEYGATNVQKAGFKVITTVNLDLQAKAEAAIADNIYKVERDGGDNAALVSIDVETGQVLAEAGSRDFAYPEFGQINMAATPRSPGSSFKPYNYAALIAGSENWGAGSIMYDLVTNFGSAWNYYTPKNYDFKEQGAQPIRNALGGSRNIPAIKAMYIAGIQNVIDTAKKLGVVSGSSCEPNCGLSAAIGDGSEIRLDEHTNAFATFSRMGEYKPLTYILTIYDSRGKTIKEWQNLEGEQVLDPQVAYIINDMLSDDNVRYIRGSSNFNYPGVTTALKTGTTNNMDNGWLMMYSTKIATGVWIGHHENTPMWCGVYGCMEGKTGSIMAQYMRVAHEGVEGAGDEWEKPSGIKTVCVDPIKGWATSSGGRCDIFPSWYEPKYADTTKTAVIDTISNKLATDCTPEAAKQTITGGGLLAELPTSDSLYNNFIQPIKARYGSAGGLIPTENDDVHTCNAADLPKVTLNVSTLAGNKYQLTAVVTQGKYELKTLNFKVTGQIISGGSYNITTSGTYPSSPLTYTASTTNPFTVSVEVIDSVLYNASDQKNITPTIPEPEEPEE